MAQDELTDRRHVVEIEHRNRRRPVERCVGGDGDDAGIVGEQELPAEGWAVQLDLRKVGVTQAFDQHEIELAGVEARDA